MKHQYDWSKLDAGWSYEPTFGGALRDSIGAKVAVEYLETGWDDCGQFTRDARAQLAKCRVEPKPKYDWSKLDAGWKVVMQGQALLRFGRRFAVAELEMCTECPPGSDDEYRELWSQALWQLAQCRVIDNTPLFDAMDKMANEAESATQYNWNKLEGTGWREGNGAFITNGKFNYWYTLLGRARLEAFDKFCPDDAVKAFTSAAAAVELCRIDWKEEVMSTCRDTGLSTVLDIRGTVAVIGEALNVDAFHRMRLNSVRLDIDKLLALSLVIERLKKLGWRES